MPHECGEDAHCWHDTQPASCPLRDKQTCCRCGNRRTFIMPPLPGYDFTLRTHSPYEPPNPGGSHVHIIR
jgi:hypothetical protein